MNRADRSFFTEWTKAELALIDSFREPHDVQQFLNSISYSADHFYRCPRSVLRDRKAHCVDGALLAAAAMRQMGFPPLVVDLRAVRDDDHFIAPFFARGRFGAVAKSNFSTLRFREPVYRSLRELAMSYFDGYFNVAGERTLRSYSVCVDLRRFDGLRWMNRDDGIEKIIGRIDAARHYPVADDKAIKRLHNVDDRLFQAGLLGSIDEGLFKPE